MATVQVFVRNRRRRNQDIDCALKLSSSIREIDRERGGVYDGGYYFLNSTIPEIVLEKKSWWSQAEAMNTYMIYHEYFPEDGFDSLFLVQWDYIQKNLVDTVYGGWYANGLDTDPEAKSHLKGQIWKSSYHNYRALANCLDAIQDE